MSEVRVGIVDYGAGNLRSLYNALDALGFEAEVINSPKLSSFSHLILPGVGSFRVGMEGLQTQGWLPEILKYKDSGRPLMGICLGMQMLLSSGEEGGQTEGLGFFEGCVSPLSIPSELPRVHVGWNQVELGGEHPVFEGLKPGSDFYFVHSFGVETGTDGVLGISNYGGEFGSVIARDNVLGVQFHPEKSQKPGLRILENFCTWEGTC